MSEIIWQWFQIPLLNIIPLRNRHGGMWTRYRNIHFSIQRKLTGNDYPAWW